MSRVIHPDVSPDQPAPGALPPSPAAEIARLVLGVAAVIALGFVAGYGETVLLLFFLILCIVAHEFGHFIAAKTGKVKVTEFFVGFGPRLWSVKRGETEYGVKGIPLGGYCRIIGMNSLEEVDPADEDHTYRSAPLWRRMLIDVAGSSMHFVIALVVLFSMFFWTGDQARYLVPPVPGANVPIGGISSLAKAEGFQVGDQIETIDGTRFATWDAQAVYIHAHGGQTIHVVVLRHGQLVPLSAVPTSQPGSTSPVIGLQPAVPVIHSSFTASISEAGGAFVSMGAQTFDALGHLVTFHGVSSYFNMLSSQKAAQSDQGQQLTTVVALPSVLNQASQFGLPTVLWMLALINLSVGLINLLPFVPVDGGRVVVGIYEGIRGLARPGYRVDMQKLLPVMYTML
ncbi:MAG TPA: site-2 protease family protein, partial [Acidimicrobiales bacterium]|nr:site-2 protease family protein [Acidimicrobiales bacterium]